MKDDLLYQIALTALENIGPKTARTLLSYCGGAREVFDCTEKELQRIPGIGPRTARFIQDEKVFKIAEQELAFLEKSGVRALYYMDEAYPQRLKRYPDAPIVLYFSGSVDLNHARTVAIVGTRKPSKFGLANCELLLEELMPFKPLIISGLAYGVDVCAHRKCVELGMPNIGVLGHGLSRIYPPAHRGVAEKMLDNGGLLTEFRHDIMPDREHFPMRNRIIAALCDALVVIETDTKGGSIISAKLANGYNKDVFAFPGRVNDPKSKGCNLLIKSHQAALIERAKDLVYVMRWPQMDEAKIIQQQLFVELGEDEKYVVDLLRQTESSSMDQLTYAMGKSGSEMASLLLDLEFKGVIKSLPGKRYMLVR